MKQAVIMLDGLTKSYGKHRGIENLTYSVLPGEIFGFIGPNGAGKTTTIRTLMGLLKPTSGNATISALIVRSMLQKSQRTWDIFPARIAIIII